MYDEAEQLGMNSIYLNLDQLIFYKARGYNQQATEMVELLLEKYPQNPEVLYEIGSHFYNASDTSSAKKYFQRSLNLYADYVSAHISLFKIELGKNNDYSAKLSLDKANEINSENIQVVSEKTKFFIKENKLEEAEEYLKSIIDGFGKNEIRYYQILAQLYQTQDLFKKCSELIPIARDISPNDPYFANLKQSLQMRKEWLQIEDKQKNDQHLVRWSDDFEESLARAARENKPVFAEFYSTDQSWNKDFSTRIYPDPKIQELLKSYVPLKVNGDLEIDLVYKYGVTWYPAIVILNDLGEILTPVRYFQFFPDISEITSELERGLGLYNKYVEGKSLKEQEITEVSNIDDALVLSNSKNLPVMVVVYSKESEWSHKLLNETFSSPLIQAELRNVVLVKVDQANNKRLVRDRNITYFPSILFLDSNGKLIYQIKGYQQPKFLAKLISEINYSMIHNQPYKDRVNWFYDLEEAKFIAAVQKKDIFTFVNADWCPYCLVMINNVFTDPLVINTLNTTFIPLELDHRYDAEQVNSIGVRGFPTLVILNPEQEEIFRISGVVDVSELLTALELERRKPIYAALGRDKYHEFYNFESLASQFLHNRFYRSAIHAAKNQITIYPEYWQSYFTIAESYRRLNNPAKMLEYSALALEKGAEIDQTFAESVLKVYSQLSDMRGYEEWLQRLIESRENNKEELSLLYILYSDYYEIMQDNNAALSMAEKAVSIYPENAEGYIRLGRLHYLENNQSVAKSHLIKGAKLDTIDPRIDFYLGLIAGRNSNFKEKQRYFNQAIQKSEKTAEKVGWRVKYTSLQGYNLYPGYLNLIEQSYRDMLELYNLTNTTERLEIINDFAYFLGKEKRKLAEALQLVNQTLQEKPDNNNFLHTKAVICFQLSQYDKAHELVRKYEDSIQRFELERNPAFAYYLGRIKWAAGDKVKAKYYFDFILKPKEYFADTIRYQNEVKSLIGVYGNN